MFPSFSTIFAFARFVCVGPNEEPRPASTGQLPHSCIPTGTHGNGGDGVAGDLWRESHPGSLKLWRAPLPATSSSPFLPQPKIQRAGQSGLASQTAASSGSCSFRGPENVDTTDTLWPFPFRRPQRDSLTSFRPPYVSFVFPVNARRYDSESLKKSFSLLFPHLDCSFLSLSYQCFSMFNTTAGHTSL